MSDQFELRSVPFQNSFVQSLPGDSSSILRSRQVFGACYSPVNPTPVSAPKLIGWSDVLGQSLGIQRPAPDDENAAAILCGNKLTETMSPYAARYGGHQFGHWAGQLGDGRAITLGEMRDRQGQLWEMQLKGAGPTPYSRTADGRAVLRSSVREFLCSEAMFHLGVPTTRALSLVLTGDEVMRDMMYDGNPEDEPGAIVCRMAPSFLRFGNYEILTASNETDLLRSLIDYTITTHFKEIGAPSAEAYGHWFAEVSRRTAVMVAHWMRVGFVHGVMNTDNMSILGLTIDYGPYGWLEGYDPMWTPNTTDRHGLRYCFGRQPQVALWNLECLATALKPLFDQLSVTSKLEDGLQLFIRTFEDEYIKMSAAKLGLMTIESETDIKLSQDLMSLLQASEIDMTIFFRNLADVPLEKNLPENDEQLIEPLRPAWYDPAELSGDQKKNLFNWLSRYRQRLAQENSDPAKRRKLMNATNPKYVLRNYMAQEAIDAAAGGDNSKISLLLDVLQRPYDEQPGHEDLAVKRPEWARHKVGCSALSCSS